MICPGCLEDNDVVVACHKNEGGSVIRRRRECRSCGRTNLSHERYDSDFLRVSKKNGRPNEAFSVLQVQLSMERACHKMPIRSDQIVDASRRVEHQVRSRFPITVESAFIEALVLEELEKLSPVARLRYVSVARCFHLTEQFMREMATCPTTKS